MEFICDTFAVPKLIHTAQWYCCCCCQLSKHETPWNMKRIAFSNGTITLTRRAQNAENVLVFLVLVGFLINSFVYFRFCCYLIT